MKRTPNLTASSHNLKWSRFRLVIITLTLRLRNDTYIEVCAAENEPDTKQKNLEMKPK